MKKGPGNNGNLNLFLNTPKYSISYYKIITNNL